MEGTAFKTMLMPFNSESFSNDSFIVVDNSFAEKMKRSVSKDINKFRRNRRRGREYVHKSEKALKIND